MLKNLVINTSYPLSQAVEVAWTLLPAVIIIFLIIPSLTLLYNLEEPVKVNQERLRIKSIGNQWFWRYEHSDFWGLKFHCFNAYLRSTQSIPRLLDTETRLTAPVNCGIRIIVSRSDVLHAWAVPRLGVKIDACPGRLNEIQFIAHRPGLVFGQCSEICGANHRFIPIALELLPMEEFITWACFVAPEDITW